MEHEKEEHEREEDKRMKRKNDNIFMDDVEPATPIDDLKADSKTIDTSECVECEEEAQG